MQFNSVRNTTEISCIDHVYTNAKHRCSNIAVTSAGCSDHDMISYTRYSKEPPSPARTIRKRSYKNFKPENYLADLGAVDWTDVLTCVDVDTANDLFTRKLVSILNVHAPWVVFQQRKFFSPWITEETKVLMKQRDELKLIAKNLAMRDQVMGTTSEDQKSAWTQFKQLRNRINNEKKNEELKYKSSKVLENLDTPAKTWSTAKNLMEWKTTGTPKQLEINSCLVTKASQVAKHMNEFFINKVENIRKNLDRVQENLTACLNIMRTKTCTLSLEHVTVKKIKTLLKELKSSKSTSVDELDNYSVKLAAEHIAAPLHHIITLSIMQDKFPTGWKYTKVIPLHKKLSQLEPKNYRPVAILSPLSKILEKVAYQQIYDYFSLNKLFHPNLHGYRKNRSTQTALLQLYDKWVKSAASGQVSGVVLIDLSAAFDLVDPELLIKKLKIYGLDGCFLTWIDSYLRDRHQAVWIDHVFSDFVSNSIGVPQGSNLGPLFFLIYYSDLLYLLDCDVEVYADDSTMSTTGTSVGEIGGKLTTNCEKVVSWMSSNQLKLNADKTHVLEVGTQQRLNITEDIVVKMDGVTLVESEEKCELLLGVQIQANLKWNTHIKTLIVKLKKRIAGLMKLKFLVPYLVRKTICQGIFNSVLVYCLLLFAGCNVIELKDLQLLQNKAAQIVTHSAPRTSRNLMFSELGWMTVNQLVAYHTLVTVFKIRKCGEPEYLASSLQNDGSTGKIIIPNPKLTLVKKSFSYRGATDWNMLPASVRSASKIGAFKHGARKWVFETVPRFLD